MSRALARDSLTIFVDGDEVPGLIAYGLRQPGQGRCSVPSDAWIAEPEITEHRLLGEGWEVLTWEIPIIIWPRAGEFRVSLLRTIRALIDGGSRVAWIGAEGLPFCDPPELFDTACMAGGVLAWMTDAGDYDCPLDPDAPLSPAKDDVLHRLRAHAKGLADV